MSPTWADAAVARIAPWYTPDFEDLVRAMYSMGSKVEQLADDVVDDDGNITYYGWSIALDPDRCPVEGLPWLAQWVGERLPVGIGEQDARDWIELGPNQWRGTPWSIYRAATRYLTGSKLVLIRERSHLDGTYDEDYLAVQTYAAQTPSTALVLQELRKVVPGDIVLEYQTVAGATWETIKTGFATWADVKAGNATWADVMGSTAGYVVYTGDEAAP